MNADIHTLTGAYALHALAGPERHAFERHLAQATAQKPPPDWTYDPSHWMQLGLSGGPSTAMPSPASS